MKPVVEHAGFCILPWISMQVHQDGALLPCCRTDQKYHYGNLRDHELRDAWNSESIRKLRLAMMAGERPPVCRDCHAVEDAGGVSERREVNARFADAFHRVSETRDDGSLSENSALLHMGLRFSNVCNFSCRTCSPENSTSWRADAKAMDRWLPATAKVTPRATSEETLAQLEREIPFLREVYFAGGEPLLDESHYLFLEKLLAAGRRDVRLVYNTNLSTLEFGRWNVLELWKKFDRVTVGASLDGVGAHAELVRKGCDWRATVLNHLRISMLPNVDFAIHCSISILNCFHLPTAIDEWITRKMITTTNTLFFNFVRDPEWYALDVLDEGERARLRELYESYWSSLETRLSPELFADIRSRMQSILNSYQGPSRPEMRAKFTEVTRKLDGLRRESLAILSPELANLI